MIRSLVSLESSCIIRTCSMNLLHIIVIFLVNLMFSYGITSDIKNVKFDQFILAVGVPYYKLLMTLGNCNKTLLFEEEKAWGKVKYNRVLDIYYKSSNTDFLVSKVDIEVVLDNTDCSVYSDEGVGRAEFSATMFIPTRVSMIFYNLKIWTCSEAILEENRQFEISVDSRERKTDENINKIPFYNRPIRPDTLPHHIYYDTSPIVYVHPNRYDKFEATKDYSKMTTPLPLSFADM